MSAQEHSHSHTGPRTCCHMCPRGHAHAHRVPCACGAVLLCAFARLCVRTCSMSIQTHLPPTLVTAKWMWPSGEGQVGLRSVPHTVGWGW